ncbi:MAG: hypothetical protein ABI416_16930 [Ginsengibacter sp.]
MNTILPYILCLASFNIASLKTCISMTDPLEEKALNEIRGTLKTKNQWTKVHAAEYLIWLGHSTEVKKEFLHENELHGTEPGFRIGIWRVLAEAETNHVQKMQWINKIFDAFSTIHGPDQLHAIETLAKLKLSPLAKFADATQGALASKNRDLSVFTLWAASYSSEEALKKNRQEFLDLAVSDSNETTRKISAFILRKMGNLTKDQYTYLGEKALSEPVASPLRNSLLNTAYVTFPESDNESATFLKIRAAMLKDHVHFSSDKRIELALSLAESGSVADLRLLQSFLDNENIRGIYGADSDEAADVRAAAAFAILKIKKRSG